MGHDKVGTPHHEHYDGWHSRYVFDSFQAQKVLLFLFEINKKYLSDLFAAILKKPSASVSFSPLRPFAESKVVKKRNQSISGLQIQLHI